LHAHIVTQEILANAIAKVTVVLITAVISFTVQTFDVKTAACTNLCHLYEEKKTM
jgi:hypothetical protein